MSESYALWFDLAEREAVEVASEIGFYLGSIGSEQPQYMHRAHEIGRNWLFVRFRDLEPAFALRLRFNGRTQEDMAVAQLRYREEEDRREQAMKQAMLAVLASQPQMALLPPEFEKLLEEHVDFVAAGFKA